MFIKHYSLKNDIIHDYKLLVFALYPRPKFLHNGNSFLCTCTIFVYSMLIAEQSENEQKVLDAHNKYRKIHNAPPMRINTEMSAEAKEWAEHLASTGTFQHSKIKDRNSDGENLLFACGMPDPVDKTIDGW